MTSLKQPRARVTPFDKIVAQDPVLRETSAERPLEGVDVVDPLADKGAFMEEVLVDIRDGARVRVDARHRSRTGAHTATGSCPAGSRQPAAEGCRTRRQRAVWLRRRAARFSGCAMAPTSCRAASRGSWVSVSRVITYFTFNSAAVLPTTREKPSHASPPRRREFSSASFPRLRS